MEPVSSSTYNQAFWNQLEMNSTSQTYDQITQSHENAESDIQELNQITGNE
jgi:hypothetical protein